MPGDATLAEDSTIVAIATPSGRGGIGVVRLSGSQALRITKALFAKDPAFQPRRVHYRMLQDVDGKRIDDALVTYFPAPGSYTGEDVVEIATHGSPVVLDWLVRACVDFGAVPARAGEFTERAFLGGRLDLTGAEAVRDLIEAQTLGQARQAAEQMGGSIASAVRAGKQTLLELIAALEAGIDFAEDDIDLVSPDDLARRIRALQPPLAGLLASFAHGRLMREGLRLAIAGEPNVGKSSLFNRLVEHERAIVTATPGTTRDVIAERISLGGIPVEVLDTAGLRETEDEAERIGVSRSRQAMAEADAVLVVVDASRPNAAHAESEYASLRGRPVLLVLNKVDLQTTGTAEQDTINDIGRDKRSWPVVSTSAVTGEGIPQLRQALLDLVSGGTQSAGNATLTNLRQRAAVDQAHAALLRAEAAASTSTPHEMILLDLYEA
ncbi:MAG: tRNA uridine-5-carboxymethylaminomethyl(34) synthesis GTPase MnmE, partial [Janthinobacterium lividum]